MVTDIVGMDLGDALVALREDGRDDVLDRFVFRSLEIALTASGPWQTRLRGMVGVSPDLTEDARHAMMAEAANHAPNQGGVPVPIPADHPNPEGARQAIAAILAAHLLVADANLKEGWQISEDRLRPVAEYALCLHPRSFWEGILLEKTL